MIVEARLHDREFLEGYAVGVEEYLARLEEYPLERVSSLTGLPAEQIEELALAYAATRPALLIAGFGLQRHHRAGQAVRAVSLLPALTGNVGVAGGGWQYANLGNFTLDNASTWTALLDTIEAALAIEWGEESAINADYLVPDWSQHARIIKTLFG